MSGYFVGVFIVVVVVFHNNILNADIIVFYHR